MTQAASEMALSEETLRALIPGPWRDALAGTSALAGLHDLAMNINAAALRADAAHRAVLPQREQWFRALDLTPPARVRAVIVGQDPYPNPRLAEGLAFSVPNGEAVPVSLRRILNEAGRVGRGAHTSRSLAGWATSQGVLLLNAVLTVPEGDARGHARLGWQRFTAACLKVLTTTSKPIAYLAFGRDAQRTLRAAGIADSELNIVIEKFHPADRRGRFIGSNPFGRANERLLEAGVPAIDWSVS